MSVDKHKVFVINLDASTLRWQKSQEQLERLQIPKTSIERLSAVDGNVISDAQRNRHFDTTLNQQQYHKTLTAGEIACYLSHRKVWAKIVAEDLDFALVLEDDFILNGDLSALFATAAMIEQPWHCIKLMEYPLKRKELSRQRINNFELVRYKKVPARTGAQLISLSGAKKLLLASEKFGRPIDIDLQYWWENDLTILGLKPYLFQVNHSSVSDIENISRRNSVKTRYLSKLYQQMYFYLENQRAIKGYHF